MINPTPEELDNMEREAQELAPKFRDAMLEMYLEGRRMVEAIVESTNKLPNMKAVWLFESVAIHAVAAVLAMAGGDKMPMAMQERWLKKVHAQALQIIVASAKRNTEQGK